MSKQYSVNNRQTIIADEDKEPAITVSGVKSIGKDDLQMHVQNEVHGGHWCAKIVFFLLLAILAGLVGLIIMENRGQSDCKFRMLVTLCKLVIRPLSLTFSIPVDTPLSESRYSEILEGWVQEDREVYEEHDAEALNELDNHEHDNEPFEEEPDGSDEDEENASEEEENATEEQELGIQFK